MAVSNNKDRYLLDESFDCTPLKVQSIFNSANSGYTKKQSRLANELTEKDPAIGQAWSVRVAGIAADLAVAPPARTGRDRVLDLRTAVQHRARRDRVLEGRFEPRAVFR